MRILITGASGSGQSTLAEQLSKRTGYDALDGDDYLWIPSDPPYLHQRSATERHDSLFLAIENRKDAIVSGSIMGWGEKLEHCFDLIVFLYVPTPIRMQRLVAREAARFGKIDSEFEVWASQYDLPETEGRSLQKHNDWLNSRICPVLRIEGTSSPTESADLVQRRQFEVQAQLSGSRPLPSGFESTRLVARPYQLSDVNAFHEAVIETIDELRLWADALPWVQQEQTLESSNHFFNDREQRRRESRELAYLVFDKESGALIGAVGLHQIDWHDRTAVVGAWSRTSKRGAGYMGEALGSVLSQAALELSLVRIEAHTNEDNAQSRKVLERLGFELRPGQGISDRPDFCVYDYALPTPSSRTE